MGFDFPKVDLSGAVSELKDFATGEDSGAAARAADAKADFLANTAIRDAGRDVNLARTGAIDSTDSVVVPEAFDAMSHPEMFAYTVELTPELLDAGAALWREAHQRMTSLVWQLWNELGAILGTDWQGAAADAALASVTGYRSESLRTLDLMDIVAGKLEQSRDGFHLTRASMPVPQSFTPSDWARAATMTVMLGPVGGAASITAMMNEENERRAQAAAVMNGTYVPTVLDADRGVPVLPPPTDPAGGPSAAVVLSSLGGGGGGGGGLLPPGATPSGYSVESAPAGTAAAGMAGADSRGAAPTTSGGAGGPTSPASTSPASTSPASTSPAGLMSPGAARGPESSGGGSARSGAQGFRGSGAGGSGAGGSAAGMSGAGMSGVGSGGGSGSPRSSPVI
ncbi:MAG: hypothetical protein WA931_12105, partial [Rhodococcus sp. (in: high G+C Gram-positive bacteria)]